MLLAGSKLTKEDRESQLYNEFVQFKMLPGENINEYYVRFHKLVNDMRNIRMTMPNIQLNSKFVNNMSPEWDRFVTAIKFNKGLKETNHEQLYAYLIQHEKHAAQDRLIIERITPTTNNQLAFVSTVQPYLSHVLSHQYPSSSNVQGRQNQNQNQRYFARGNGTTGNRGAHNKAGNANDKMLLMQAQENGAVLDEEELLFLAGEQANTFDADVVNQPLQDLALNEDNILQEDECDSFDSNVDDEPTAQSIFMANLSSAGPTNLQAGPSNASILSEVHILKNDIDNSFTNQDEHEIHNKVERANVIDSTSDEMGNSNVIPYEQYLSVNNVSEQVAIYKQRARFELTEREQRMDDQMRMLIQNRNKTKENLKKELHFVKLQLNSTMENNKIFEETVTALKQEFKQKETKFLTDFSNMKNLKDKHENKLHSQDQSIQTVHMMLNPIKVYVQKTKTTIGAKNPFYLIRAKKAQPVLYDDEELLKTHHVPVIVPSSEEDLEVAEITRIKMHEKINDSVFTEVRAMKAVFEDMEAKVDQNAIDKKCGEIERKNLLIKNENLIANCIAQDVFYTVTDSALTASRFHDLSTAYNAAMIRAVELESQNSRLLGKIKYDNHDTMIKEFSKLEVAYFNLQLKHQHLNENIDNLKSKSSKDVPEFDAFFELGMQDDQIQSHKNTICKFKAHISELKANKNDDNLHLDYKSLDSQNSHLKETVTTLQNQLENFKAENAKIKLHYQELFDSIKVTHVKTTAKENSLQTEIENLKTQLKGKMSCITSDDKTPKVSAFEKYAIDVEPIPPRQRNNRDVHHGYLNSLRDTLDTLREIVEEARNELPSDNKFIATTPVTKKKRVTFADPLETSGNNTPKHVKQQSVQPTNTPTVPSIGVSTTTTAKRSQSKSHTSHDKTLPAKSVPKKKVEDHPRNNMSKLRKKNRVDSCTSVRRTIFDTNSNSLCKTCNECINSISHDKCVDKFLKSSKTTTVRKMWRVKHVKQTWQPMGKLFTIVGHHWKPTGRTLPLGAQCPLTRKTTPKIVPVKIWKSTGRLIPLRGQCPLTRPTALTSDIMLADPQAHHAPMEYNIVVQIVLWYLDSGCSKRMTGDRSWLKNFMKKFIGTVRLRNDHFGAIMGYGDYVISDSSINGKKYILVIVDDYSRFTRVKFLRSKDETLAFIIKLLKQLQVGLNKTVRFVQTDNGTEFNGIVERQNRTLVEAAWTMLIFSKAPLFLWAEAMATACYTQNRSLIHTLHNKTPYELVHDKKLDLSFLRIFGALCYPTNDSADLGKLKAKADIRFFVGYAPNRKGYRIYNKRTQQIMETIHVTFDEMTRQTAHVLSSPGPVPNLLTPGPISSGRLPNLAPAIPYVPPTNKELELLLQPMFDDYFENPTGDCQVLPVPVAQAPVNPTGSSVSISFDQDAPSGSHLTSSSDHQSSLVHNSVAAEHSFEVNLFAAADPKPFLNVFTPYPNSEASSSGDITIPERYQSASPHEHL
ncbi:retrovirus-related pol polyprotein from transposon TNT 1-94 [Tanacetum coccineum]